MKYFPRTAPRFLCTQNDIYAKREEIFFQLFSRVLRDSISHFFVGPSVAFWREALFRKNMVGFGLGMWLGMILGVGLGTGLA